MRLCELGPAPDYHNDVTPELRPILVKKASVNPTKLNVTTRAQIIMCKNTPPIIAWMNTVHNNVCVSVTGLTVYDNIVTPRFGARLTMTYISSVNVGQGLA